MDKVENYAILITDIAGFTERTAKTDRVAFSRLMRIHARMMRSIVGLYDGRYLKSTGDGILSVFKSSTNAALCAMAIQDAIAEYNFEKPAEEQISVRVSVHLGEVLWQGCHDILGEAVNLTARIESVTPPGEIYLSESVNMSVNKAEVQTDFVGEFELKGIKEKVQLYRIPPGLKARLVCTDEPLEAVDGIPFPYSGMRRPSVISLSDRIVSPKRRPVAIAVGSLLLTAIMLAALAYNVGWLSPEGRQVVETMVDPLGLLQGTSAGEVKSDDPQRSPLLVYMDEGERLLAQ